MRVRFIFLSSAISSCLLTMNCFADAGIPHVQQRTEISTQNGQPTSTQHFVGVVKAVNRVELPNQTQIQLLLNTDQGDLLVILGPANFVDQAKVRFQAGDKVTILGYPINANGQRVILAAQVQKNGYILQLLSENRQPLWANAYYAGTISTSHSSY